IALRLSEQEDVEGEVDHRRAIRCGVLRIGGGSHVDSILDGWEAWAVGGAIARRLPAFLMGPLQRHWQIPQAAFPSVQSSSFSALRSASKNSVGLRLRIRRR